MNKDRFISSCNILVMFLFFYFFMLRNNKERLILTFRCFVLSMCITIISYLYYSRVSMSFNVFTLTCHCKFYLFAGLR